MRRTTRVTFNSIALLLALIVGGDARWRPADPELEEELDRREIGMFQSGGQEISFGPPAVPGLDGPVLQPLENVPAQPFVLPTRQSRTVEELMAEQAAADARDPRDPGAREPIYRHEFEVPGRRGLPQHPDAPAVAQWPPPSAADVPSPLVSPPLVLASFDGPDISEAGFFPPDSMGDVGPTQYIVALNGRIRSYSKTTLAADGVLDVTSNTFFNSVRNNFNAVDPRIRFDRQTNRWFIVYISVSVPNRYLIAFSDSATITAATTWSYTFFADTTVNGSGQPCLGDYETLGIDANALYIGTNEFCGANLNTITYFASGEYVIPKAALVAGAGTIAGFLQSSYFTPQGVDNYDASPAVGYFVAVDNGSIGVLRLSQISNPSTPSPSKTTRSITVLTTSLPRSVPHLGGTKNLDGLDDRLMNAVARDGRIWTAHAICVNTSGVAVPRTDASCRNGVRWYELSNITTASPAVNQAGTIFDPATTNPRHYWVPSVNINAHNVVVFGFASAAANTFAGAAYVRRELSDTLGTTQAPVQHLSGLAIYNTGETATSYRWGDYSLVSVDPSDDRTFWTIQEFGKASATWGTKVTRLVSTSVGPSIVGPVPQTTPEDTATAAIAFTVSDTDTPADTLTVTGSSSNESLVPNANIVFGGSGESRTVTITPAANANGAATITLTVSDGTETASASFELTVTPVNDLPAISDVTNQTIAEDQTLGPLAFTIGDLETAAASLAVTAASSNTGLVPLTGLALGGTGALRTLTVTPAANQFGTSTITVTVNDGAASVSDTFTLTVTALNDTPTISDVANQTTAEDQAIGPLAFTIADVETPAASLTVTASSSNTDLVAASGLALGGTGTSRTLTVTPSANQSGTSMITVTVSDGTANVSDNFTLTVTPVNDAPTIGDLLNQTIAEDQTVGPIAFTIGDLESAVGTLTVIASASNTTLVPQGALIVGGAGSNRTLTVTPAANQSGTSTITVTVGDGTANVTAQFLLTVTPVNDGPSVAAIADKLGEQDGIVAPFQLVIADVDTPPAGIVVTVTAGNSTLLPPSGVVVGGAGFDRTLSLQPAAGQTGSTTVTVTVSDGSASASSSFTLTVMAPAGPPGAPSSFAASLAGGTLSLSWGLPGSGAPPTGYILQVAIDPNFAVIVYDQPTGSAAQALTIPNVPNGIFYLRVRASNAFGTGPPSNVQQIGGPPGPPSAFVATLTGTTLTMTWAAPATGSSPTDYLLEAALDASFSAVIYSQGTGSPATSLVIPGVPPGTYFLRLRARNAAGVSGPSNAQTIGAPTGCTAAPGPASGFTIAKLGGLNVQLSWTAPAGGANGATDYAVQAALDASFLVPVFNQPLGSSATSFGAIAPPGTFFVRIVARNACGSAAPSNTVMLVMP